jgi:hypothetical protein
MPREKEILRRYWLGVMIAALVIVTVAAAALYLETALGANASQTTTATNTTPMTMAGSMFVSDAGKSHGGFEYTASWNASLQVSGSAGTLTFALNVGLGDALTKHQFAVTDFTRNSTDVSMKIDGQSVTLVWVNNDQIWNGTYGHFYIASWGGYAPPNEIRGSISPTDFSGLTSFWYVELRLR